MDAVPAKHQHTGSVIVSISSFWKWNIRGIPLPGDLKIQYSDISAGIHFCTPKHETNRVP